MKDIQKIALVLIGLFAASRLLRKTTPDEPSTFIDEISPIPSTPNNDPSLSLSFCEIRPATTAGTSNFALSEFHSKDGTLVPEIYRGNIQLLMEQLQIIRTELNAPIIITSGYRSPAHNEYVGGVSSSKHMCGMAADISVVGVDPVTVQQTILNLIAEGRIIDGGLGLYNTFTHYDIGASRRWDNR